MKGQNFMISKLQLSFSIRFLRLLCLLYLLGACQAMIPRLSRSTPIVEATAPPPTNTPIAPTATPSPIPPTVTETATITPVTLSTTLQITGRMAITVLEANEQYKLGVLDLETGQLIGDWIEKAIHPAWTPNSGELSYVIEEGGYGIGQEIFTPLTGAFFPFDTGGPPVSDLDWSPNSKFLAFSAVGGHSADVIVYNVEASTSDNPVVTILTEGADISPTWSPDGDYLAFISFLKGGLSVMRTDGSEQKQLTEYDVSQALSLHSPTWSPNGAKIAYGFLETPQLLGSHIYIYDLDESEPSRLNTNEYYPLPSVSEGGSQIIDWSPDGQALAYIVTNDDQEYSLIFTNLDGSEQIEYPLPFDDPILEIAWQH